MLLLSFVSGVMLMGSAAAQDAGAAEILKRLPAQNSAETEEIAKQILQLGPAAIQEICGQLVPPGGGNDTPARFALSGLVQCVARGGSEEARAMVSNALIAALGSATDPEVKAFLISQLQLAARDEAVEALGGYLADERLSDPAARALQAIGAPAAEAKLLEALSAATDVNRVTLIDAAGRFRSERAVEAITPFAANDNRETRLAALYALANIGHPSSADILAQAAKVEADYERAQALSFYLLYARRRAEAGDAAACEKIGRELLGHPQVNVQCAALATLVSVLGNNALPDLLAAMKSDSGPFREAALALAARIPGEEATKQWIELLPNASAPARVELIRMLGKRGDAAALPAVMKALKDEDPGARVAAITACTRLGGNEALPSLMAVTQSTTNPDEVNAMKEALLSLPMKRTLPVVSAALYLVSSPMRVALIEYLAERRAEDQAEKVFALTQDPDPAVRVAALRALEHVAGEKDLSRLVDLMLVARSEDERHAAQKSVVALANAIPESGPRADAVIQALEQLNTRRSALLETMAWIGGGKALDAVTRELRSADPATQTAALQALASWKDTSAIERLCSLLEDQSLRDMAAAALVKIIVPGEYDDDGKRSPAAYKALETLIEKIQDADLIAQARKHLLTRWEDEEGFVSLFNGQDLTGWVGDTKGYLVEDGKIVCKPGGNLYTEKEYRDFAFRFEFKLTPGANNGLGIRAPLEGDSAYRGMEIQIIDNTSPIYKDIFPWQVHGSVYGAVPAKRGYLNPVGEWNQEEVIARGMQITVILNGVTIVDADIEKASANGTIDGHDHPGLKNEKGHIGFLGHGSVVEFRNIRVKEL
ncbi:MAG: family 16 glycoside hydrolase [bacterium]